VPNCDLVRANLLARGVTVPTGDPLVLNVATGCGTAINAPWRALAGIASLRVGAHHKPARAGDLLRRVLDRARSGRGPGWQPEVDLDSGPRQTRAIASAA
jgi:UDP-glucose 4-epimerase